MKAAKLCFISLALAGCFQFDDKLKACRNDAGLWICGDAGQGTGGGDGGGEGEYPAGPATEFQCFGDGGWCWEHPRPAGGRFRSVWASGPNDLWIGTVHGLLLHRNREGWRTTFLAPDLSVETLCGKNGVVYAGGALGGQAGAPRLFAIDPATGVATAIANSGDEVSSLACGADRLWAAHTQGAWSIDYETKILSDVPLTLNADELGASVVSPGPGKMLLLTGTTSNPSPGARVLDETNAAQFTYSPDAAMSVNFVSGDLWLAGDGTLQAAFNGQQSVELWANGTSGWSRFWPTPDDPTLQIYDGAPWSTGAIAVGAFGLVAEIQNNVVTKRNITSFGNSYHSGVAGLPTGEAFVVGEPGCVLERRTDGGWFSSTNCDRLLDFSIGLEEVAISDDMVYRREDGGWSLVSQGSGLYGVWTNPSDAGLALLSNDSLTYNGEQRNVTFAEARDLVALDDSRVVVVLDDGTAFDTALTSDFDGGSFKFPDRPRITVDPQTRTFWAFVPAGRNLWSSDAPGAWTQVDAGVGADITDVSAAFGRVWVTAGDTVHVLRDAGWFPIRRTGRSFQRVIALDDTRALTFETSRPAEIYTLTGTATNFGFFPFDPVLSAVRGNELWVLGAEEGLIRRTFPAQ